MKKRILPAVRPSAFTRRARPVAGKIAWLLGRLGALGRRQLGHAFSLARTGKSRHSHRFEWHDTTRQPRPHSQPRWLVIAVKWFAPSERPHPVKIHIEHRK